MRIITVGTFLEENKERLVLELIAGRNGTDNVLISPELNRPGLALTGFIDLFTYNRVQLIGNTEILYLSTLTETKKIEAFEIICQFALPCIIFTNGVTPSPGVVSLCNTQNIPLIISSLSTTQFVHLFSYYLEDNFAPSTAMHGTLVDVYGMGLFFTGRPGIGKSEVTLDLVERGHRLVADDVVHIIRKSRGIVVGTGNELTRSLIEIRGVGIVDVQQMFGIRATRVQKRIEVEVQLVDWDDKKTMDRTGLDENITTILDVEIPKVEIPIYPGKYIAVIVESIALNQLLKIRGYNAAKELANRQMNLIRENEKKNVSK
ncbi:MAG: HPr(Ser) kinase/phosphatase [Candidatus Latescibacteria bacterium]|nr:HPr(Ser) kinase/phosphatase [Candidatus Latescibacterota bacterium]